MLDKIKSAVDVTQRAQRNYDLTKYMPQEHLDTLIYAASNSPSKQNETHYRLHVYTDKEIIEQVHNSTKKFTLGIHQALEEGKGEEWLYENRSVTNSQIYANVLFIYEEIRGAPRGATHLRAQAGDKKSQEYAAEQRYYSIGISIGELILSASLLGYKTGICSAMDDEAISSSENPKSLFNPILTLSPSRMYANLPSSCNLIANSFAMVDLPEPDKPVNHMTGDFCLRSSCLSSFVTSCLCSTKFVLILFLFNKIP